MNTKIIKVPIVLPVGHLSFSQIILWLSAKETYRKKYYPDVRPEYTSTIEMLFGNQVTEAMEQNEEWVSFIPRYETFEYDASFEVDNILVKAYIDNFKIDTGKIREQKTGRTPWTEGKVKKHLQLDIYSLLVKLKLGYVDDETSLLWAKTRKKVKTVELADGSIIEAESNEIELTGEYKEFFRIITEEEREACRALINRVAKEISEDYRAMKHLYN